MDVAHPIGDPHGINRPIVVKFVDRRSKITMMNFVGNLKSTKISVSDQLPDDTRQRRSALIPKMKVLKHNASDPKTVNMNRDTLYAGGQRIDPQFTLNTLPTSSLENYVSTKTESINHTVVHTDKITIQGHAAKAPSVDAAASVLMKLKTINTIARAPHNTYAYRVHGRSGETIEGYDDDGLYGTGKLLLDALQKENITMAIVVLTKFTKGVPPKAHAHKLMKVAKDIIVTSGIRN